MLTAAKISYWDITSLCPPKCMNHQINPFVNALTRTKTQDILAVFLRKMSDLKYNICSDWEHSECQLPEELFEWMDASQTTVTPLFKLWQGIKLWFPSNLSCSLTTIAKNLLSLITLIKACVLLLSNVTITSKLISVDISMAMIQWPNNSQSCLLLVIQYFGWNGNQESSQRTRWNCNKILWTTPGTKQVPIHFFICFKNPQNVMKACAVILGGGNLHCPIVTWIDTQLLPITCHQTSYFNRSLCLFTVIGVYMFMNILNSEAIENVENYLLCW